MATKPVKVLADLQTRRQILKLDNVGNVLFKVSGSLGNGVVLVELPMTASAGISARLYGTASYALNAATASYAENAGGLSIVYTSGSITGSGIQTNPIILKDPLIIGAVTASSGFSGFLFGTASFANAAISASFATTASYVENANINTSSLASKADVTGALANYATSNDVSSSFVTPSQVTGALTIYALSSDISASFVENSELTSAISNFPTRNEVSGAITSSLSPYATSLLVSSSFASLSASNVFSGLNTFSSISGTSAYFSQNLTVNGTASIGILNYVSASSLSIGDKYIILASGSTDHLSLDGSGVLWGSGAVGPTTGSFGENAHILYRSSGDLLEIFPGLSASFVSSSFVGNLLGTASSSTSSSFATTSSYAITASSATNLTGNAVSSIQNAYNRLRYQQTGNFDITGSATIMLPTSSLGASSFPVNSFDYINVSVMVKEDTRWINDLISVQMYTSSTNIYVEISAPSLTNTDQYKLLAVNENSNYFLVI